MLDDPPPRRPSILIDTTSEEEREVSAATAEEKRLRLLLAQLKKEDPPPSAETLAEADAALETARDRLAAAHIALRRAFVRGTSEALTRQAQATACTFHSTVAATNEALHEAAATREALAAAAERAERRREREEAAEAEAQLKAIVDPDFEKDHASLLSKIPEGEMLHAKPCDASPHMLHSHTVHLPLRGPADPVHRVWHRWDATLTYPKRAGFGPAPRVPNPEHFRYPPEPTQPPRSFKLHKAARYGGEDRVVMRDPATGAKRVVCVCKVEVGDPSLPRVCYCL